MKINNFVDKRIRIMSFVLFSIISILFFLFFFSCSKKISDEEGRNFMEILNKNNSITENILFTEKQLKKGYNKNIILTLSSLYMQNMEYEKAKKILLKYIKKINVNILDKYEYTSYYIGMTLDNILKLNQKEINMIEKINEKYKRYIVSKIKVYEKRVNNKNANEKIKKEYEKLLIYKTDPYQLERMMGDYFYRINDQDNAYIWYYRFYKDLSKPVSYFTPQPLRNYIQILLNRKEYKEALIYQGYLCNLSPYMFEDLFALCELYETIQEPLSALFLSMLINTISQNYDEIQYHKSLALILSYLEKIKGTEYYQLSYNLVNSFLIGKDPENIEQIINKFQLKGINNSFFEYLLGVCSTIKKDFETARKHFEKFNMYYPYCAESYFFILDSILNTQNEEQKDIEQIIKLAEKVIELKPDSQMTLYCKRYLGKNLGLNEKQSIKLITTPELLKIIDDFTKNGAPVDIFKPLLDSFDNPKNVYLLAAIQILSGINERKGELITYLKMYYLKANKEQKINIDKVIQELEK